METRFWKFLILGWLSLQTTVVLAQTKTCNVRLNVFPAQKIEYRLGLPLKNIGATVVNLSNNKVTAAQSANGNPFFSEIPEGEYNVVAMKDGYTKTSKLFTLNCRIVDGENAYDEIILMDKGDVNRSVQMDYVRLCIDRSPAPPKPFGGYPKDFKFNEESVNSPYLNERAVYLPVPTLTAEGKETSEYYKKIQGKFYAKVYVTADAAGNITEAFYTDDNNYDKKLFPDILEKTKQAKFLPFRLDGKPSAFSGVIIYSF